MIELISREDSIDKTDSTDKIDFIIATQMYSTKVCKMKMLVTTNQLILQILFPNSNSTYHTDCVQTNCEKIDFNFVFTSPNQPSHQS